MLVAKDAHEQFRLECGWLTDFPTETIDKIFALYSCVFGHKSRHSAFISAIVARNRSAWRWKFEHPYLRGSLFVFGHRNSELAGFGAIVGRSATCFGQLVVVGHCVDSMVAPHYQRRGLFTAMTRLLQDCSKEHFSFLYGFPNANNVVIRERTGFLTIEQRPLLAKMPEPRNRLKGVRSVLRGDVNSNFDRAWERQKQSIDISVEKGKDYVLQRYFDNPYCQYALHTTHDSSMGYVVTKDFAKMTHIVDMVADSPETFRALVDAAERSAQHKKEISAYCSASNWLWGEYLRAGFEPRPHHTLYMVYPGSVAPSKIKAARWHVSMSDNDIF